MKTILKALIVTALIPAALVPATLLTTTALGEEAPHGWLDDPAAALVLIDIQDFYFPGGSVPLVRPETASGNAGRVLEAFRGRERFVVHVGHSVRAGGGFHAAVAPLDGEAVVMKSEVNAFLGTNLEEILRAAGIDKLVLCGMQTHMCLEGAARAAADLGFECVIIGDACATRDLERGGTIVPADGVHAATLATLDGVYAEVMSAATFLGTE